MICEAAPTGKRGRQPGCGDAAIQTFLTMKVLFGLALRQTTGFVASLLRLIGLNWAVPDFSTQSRRQKTLKVNIPCRGSQGPLHLLIQTLRRPDAAAMESGNHTAGVAEIAARCDTIDAARMALEAVPTLEGAATDLHDVSSQRLIAAFDAADRDTAAIDAAPCRAACEDCRFTNLALAIRQLHAALTSVDRGAHRGVPPFATASLNWHRARRTGGRIIDPFR